MENTEKSNSRHATNGAPHPTMKSMGTHVDQLGDAAYQLYEEARGAVNDFSQILDIRGRVERHPYGTLAAAAAIGYVLGGGLFTGLTGRMVGLGFRLAALPFVKEELIGMAKNAMGGVGQATTDNE